jgi:cobalt/nickel transport system ATP-binding protein
MALIELRDITHSWGATTGAMGPIATGEQAPLIDGFSLSLKDGERVALTGPNGSGKTTLMHIIMGLVPPSRGSIAAFGSTLESQEDFASMRRRVGFLFQDSDDQLFCPTVEEDVAFGPLNLGLTHAEARERAEGTLVSLGIAHLRKSITHRLSGGEKRLVAFATIAAMRPEAYILDEPTSGLDPERRDIMLSYIKENVRSALITSHDRAFLEAVTSRSVAL